MLVCPNDRAALDWRDDSAVCSFGHQLPVVHGVPVALRDDLAPTHTLWRTTETDVRRLSTDSRVAEAPAPDTVDRFVEKALVATCGNLYRRCRLPLQHYPIPDLPLPNGDGRLFLDVGSNWGRWSFAAARRGYRVVAIDPSLDAALAGSRIARQLGLPVAFVLGDARCLPFRAATFDFVFSYSVLQHLNKAMVEEILHEFARVSSQGAVVRVQMANLFGLRQLSNYITARALSVARFLTRRRRPPRGFRVRGWTPGELLRTFAKLIGPSVLTADGFFSLNARPTDVDLLGRLGAGVVRVSERLRALADEVPPLARLADSVWIESQVETAPTVD
jgi:SAM-dependent methyltransferase